MRRVGAGLALTAAVLGGCSSPSETHPRGTATPPAAESTSAAPTTPALAPQPTYEQAKANLIKYFGESQAYWASQGVTISATKLDIVDGDQSFTCDKPYHAVDIAAGYCEAYNTIFATRAWIQYMDSDQFFPRSPYELPREEVFATHEPSHAAQYVLKLITSPNQYKDPTFAIENELQADCLAGRTVRAIDPNAARIVLNPQFVYFPGDGYPGQAPTGHGTTEQRRQEFQNGFNGGQCQLGQ